MPQPRRAAQAPASTRSECSAAGDAGIVGASVLSFGEASAGTGFGNSTPNDVSGGPVVTIEDDLISTWCRARAPTSGSNSKRTVVTIARSDTLMGVSLVAPAERAWANDAPRQKFGRAAVHERLQQLRDMSTAGLV